MTLIILFEDLYAKLIHDMFISYARRVYITNGILFDDKKKILQGYILPYTKRLTIAPWLSLQIFRSDIAGNKMESVYQSAAQDLAVDALNGFLYWTSSHSVEAARLNGDGHIEYQFWPYFSGQLASGLTLDTESKRLFWIIQGYEGGKLYTADMAGFGTEDVAMTTKMVASIGSMSR